MKKIMCSRQAFDLAGKTVYRENSDCSYWTLTKETDNGYEAVNDETGEERTLTRFDIVGDYICE